ncbi:MAG: hypothetical protein H6603_05175 [Flavobacteriales bacterium]|nr:hypothetical protein [Flavobacteriales bacterium]
MRLCLPVVLVSVMAVFAVLPSCTKKDEVPPSVTISSPFNGAEYNVFDTIQVSFQIEDETALVSASAEVLSQDFYPITPKTNITNYNGSAQVILDDKLIESGEYFLVVNASDGTNDSREFVEIRINAIPKVRRAVYVATSSGSGQDAVWQVDSLLQQYISWSQPGQDVLKVCANSAYDKLALIGRLSTGLKVYSLPFGSLDWSDDVFNVSQTERYQDLICNQNSFFASIYDREIRGYTLSGALIKNFPTGDYRAETLFRYENTLLAEMNLVGDDRHFLNVYYESTMALLNQVDFDMDIVAIVSLQGDEVLVFGNNAGQAKVYHYDIGENSFWEPRQLPVGKVYDATRTEGVRVVFTHDDGVYTYTYSPNFLNLLRSGSAYRQVHFDVDNGAVLSASENILEEISQSGQLVSTVVLPDSIVSFDIHYTR